MNLYILIYIVSITHIRVHTKYTDQHIHSHTYIYIYTERERERGGGREEGRERESNLYVLTSYDIMIVGSKPHHSTESSVLLHIRWSDSFLHQPSLGGDRR